MGGVALSAALICLFSEMLLNEITQLAAKAALPVHFASATAAAQSSLETDLTPSGFSAVRPCVVKIDEFFYLHVLRTKPGPPSFILIKLKSNLQRISVTDIYSGHNPTDARMAAGPNGFLWYSFETVYFDRSPGNFLNVARYDVSNDTRGPVLNAFQTELASGFFAQPHHHPARGSELMDDPGPLFYKGSYYILTKTYDSPQIVIRSLSQDLSVKDVIRMDLRAQIGDFFLSPGVLIAFSEKVYLITGIANGPCGDPQSSSKIVAVELSDDLKKPKGPSITLTAPNDFASYVSSARQQDGRIYVLYNVFTGRQDPLSHQHEHIGKLGIFDSSTFKPISTVEINRGTMLDNLMAMEIVGDTLYVFYNTSTQRIMVRQFRLNEL